MSKTEELFIAQTVGRQGDPIHRVFPESVAAGPSCTVRSGCAKTKNHIQRASGILAVVLRAPCVRPIAERSPLSEEHDKVELGPGC